MQLGKVWHGNKIYLTIYTFYKDSLKTFEAQENHKDIKQN